MSFFLFQYCQYLSFFTELDVVGPGYFETDELLIPVTGPIKF